MALDSIGGQAQPKTSISRNDLPDVVPICFRGFPEFRFAAVHLLQAQRSVPAHYTGQSASPFPYAHPSFQCIFPKQAYRRHACEQDCPILFRSHSVCVSQCRREFLTQFFTIHDGTVRNLAFRVNVSCPDVTGSSGMAGIILTSVPASF